MIKFDRALNNEKAGKDCIRYLQHSLEQIISRLFNKRLEGSDFRNAPLVTAMPTKTTLPLLQLLPFGLHPVRSGYPPGAAPISSNLQAAMARLASSAEATIQAIQAQANAAALRANATAIQANLAAIQANRVSASKNPPNGVSLSTNGRYAAPGSLTPPLSSSRQAAVTGPMMSAAAIPANGVLVSTNPPVNKMAASLHYTAPRNIALGVPSNALISPPIFCKMKHDCIICFDSLKKRRCVALKACNHVS